MFGKRLTLLRGDKTQEEIAKALGIKRARYAHYEQERSEPDLETLNKISNLFHVSIDYILGKTDITLPNAIPIGDLIRLPIIGTVIAGPNGIAYEEPMGFQLTEKQDINGGNYYYLKVKGDSMLNEGIVPGDLVLVREQTDVENGEKAIVIVDGEEGTLKKIYKQKNSIMLQSANPSYPPRIFEGKDMQQVKIVGKVKGLIRKF